MHELSIALSIIDIASEESRVRGDAAVLAVHLKVGRLSGVVIDAALLRPGRLQEHFFLDTPSVEDLVGILKLRLAKMPLSRSFSVDAVAEEMFARQASGADVEGLCREVCLIALRGSQDPEEVEVSQPDFHLAMSTIGKKRK